MRRRWATAALADQGMTLVETLVAIVTGVVVLGAALAIFEVALHQSSRLTDYTQATQLGRTAMTRVIDELHSACIASGFKPVQEGSGESKLVVINAYSENAEIAAGEKTRKDEISWASEKLKDATYSSTGGTWPEFTFASTAAKNVLLAEHVTKAEIENPETKVKEKPPIFRYFDYATKASAEAAQPVSTLTEVKPPETGFTAAEAEKVAGVQVSFKTGATSGNQAADRFVDLTNQVTFALSPARSEATIQDGPCQ